MRQTCLSLYSCILSHVLAGTVLGPDEQASYGKDENALCLDGAAVTFFILLITAGIRAPSILMVPFACTNYRWTTAGHFRRNCNQHALFGIIGPLRRRSWRVTACADSLLALAILACGVAGLR